MFAPVLAFLDIVSGPRSGNGDTSLGQTNDGAIVTAWGYNLGVSKGGSRVDGCGITNLATYYWGNASDSAYCPSVLYNSTQKLQMVIFQISHFCALGTGNITVTVGGVTSNSLHFTTQDTGVIRFVAPGGTGSGTYASPSGSLQDIVDVMSPGGDITYVRDGYSAPGGINTSYNSRYFVATDHTMLVAYPGANVQIGDANHDGFYIGHSGAGYFMSYSKMTVFGGDPNLGNLASAIAGRANMRVVGCKIQCPKGEGKSGALISEGNNRYTLGNWFTNCGNPAAFDAEYHTIYDTGKRDQGTGNAKLESYSEIGWNRFNDNAAARAVNIYNTSNSGITSSPITQRIVHDNWITAQQWDAILFGNGVVGVNYCYNNIIDNVGLSDYNTSGACVGINFRMSDPSNGEVSFPSTVMYVYNNILRRCGSSGAPATARGCVLLQMSIGIVSLKNNIFDQPDGLPYVATAGINPTTDSAINSNNLFSGAGAAPSWSASSIGSDPLFVSIVAPIDLHLQIPSPARANGAVLGYGGWDFDGTARPTDIALDIGAYQLSAPAVNYVRHKR